MADWLLYYQQHQVLMCQDHGYAVDNLADHLLRQHRDSGSKLQATLVSEYAGVPLQQPESAYFDHRPENPMPAVDGLTIHWDGFACWEAGCSFMTVSWKWLRVHFNKTYCRRGMEIQGRQSSVALQTLFMTPRNRVAYFCVAISGAAAEGPTTAVTTEEPTEQQPLEGISARWTHNAEQQEELQQVLASAISRHKTTNWLRRAQWSEHSERQNLVEINACSWVPGCQRSGELGRMSAAFNRLFFDRYIDRLKSMPLITRLLLASPNHSFQI